MPADRQQTKKLCLLGKELISTTFVLISIHVLIVYDSKLVAINPIFKLTFNHLEIFKCTVC